MRRLVAAAFVSGLAISGSAQAAPVVFTAYAVTDGALGSLTFTDSPVVMTFSGDTENISMQTVGGKAFYRIDKGSARVSVTVAGTTTSAQLTDGQVYVHYDVENSIVGFGSSVSPDYPLTMSCGLPNSACAALFGPNGIPGPFAGLVGAIADFDASPPDRSFYSAAVLNHRQTLAKSMVLTGTVNACGPGYNFFPLTVCPSPPATKIQTDQGEFYLQDQTFGDGIFTVQVSPRHDD